MGGRDLSGSARAGLVTGFVSNGNGTTRVLEYLRPHIDLYKVDLKSFDDRRYRELGGRLQPILDTIQWLHDAGVWVEIVTLLVPGFNDSDERAARAHRVSRRRLTRHPLARHRVSSGLQDDRPGEHDAGDAAARGAHRSGGRASATSTPAICRAGSASSSTPTATPAATRLISRYGYLIQEYALTPDGACPTCAHRVPGRWSAAFEGQTTAHPFLPHDRTQTVVSALGISQDSGINAR